MEKKLTAADMVGRIVMVYPDLTTDPVNKQGVIGKVNSFFSYDIVAVSFPDGTVGRYQTTALATVLPKKKLLEHLYDNLDLLSATRQREIMQIVKLVMEKNTVTALGRAMENDSTKSYCTVSLQEWSEIKQRQKNEKSQGKGIGT